MNNGLIVNVELVGNEPMATSRDIAHKLNKQHQHVLSKIREVLTPSEYRQREYSYGNNNKSSEYLLTKDSFILLVMNYEGYNDFKRAYITQFNAMQDKLNSIVLPQSFSEALQLAADQAKQLELQAPKVEFFDTVTKSDSWLTFKEVANMLAIPQLGRNNLTKKLRELKYINDFNKPYQRYIDQKLFKVIETPKGNNVYTSTVVSQKGLDKLIKVLK